MEVVRHAVDRAVHRHRRDHDAVLERQAAHRERHEHRRHAACSPRREPALVAAAASCASRSAQVLVADALRARQQRVGELLGLACRCSAARSRTTRSSCARRSGSSAPRRCAAPRRLPAPRRALAAARRTRRQLDRVLERELGARADREMRGVRRVAHQHHRHAAAVRPRTPVHPVLADHARKADPDRRAAQVRGVADQRVAVRGTCANSFSQKAMPSACSIVSRPCARHTSSGVSTMKVEVSSSNW